MDIPPSAFWLESIMFRSLDRVSLLFMLLLGAVLFAYVLYPSGVVVLESLRTPAGWSGEHYRAFVDPATPSGMEALWGSVWVSVITVLLAAVVGVLLATVFARYEFPGRRLFSVLALFPMVLPPLIGVITFLFLYGESGILPRTVQWALDLESVPLSLDGVWAILLVHTYSFYPYFYLFCRNALEGIDPSLNEAATGLGAGRWTILRRVTLPLLTPALVGASLLVFMVSMVFIMT